jgi:heat shock protein HslJ
MPTSAFTPRLYLDAEPDRVAVRPTAVKTGSLLALVVVLVTACSSAGGSSAPSASLDGRTFLSTGVTGHSLVPGSTVRLQFEAGRVGAGTGCNQVSGPYTIVDGKLTLGQVAMTAMGCEQPLMDQDSWLVSFLGGAKVTLAGDTLTLANGDVTMTLADRKVADPDRTLEGTRWVVDGIVTGDAVSSVPAGITAALTIADGKLALEAGCNIGGGSVTVSPARLTVGPLMLTKKACERGPSMLESAVLEVLTGEVAYTIEADVLTLTNGRNGLTLRAAG